MEYRIERDSMGEMQVPADKYWGAQTQRSLENFPIGWEKMPMEIIYALTTIKKAAAVVNRRMGKLDEKRIDESVTRILKIKILRGVISLEDPLLEPVKATEEEEATTAVESTTEQEKMDKKNPEKKKEVTKAKASTTEE